MSLKNMLSKTWEGYQASFNKRLDLAYFWGIFALALLQVCYLVWKSRHQLPIVPSTLSSDQLSHESLTEDLQSLSSCAMNIS
jgi:hypothetical protein